MSILSQLFEGKITWQTAVTQIEAWGQKTVAASPALTAVTGEVVTDLKQAASDAISTADTLAGPLLATGAAAVSSAFTAAANAYLGPVGVAISPAVVDSIGKIRDGLKSVLDEEAAALIASLAPAPAATVPQQLSAASPLPNGS